MGSNRWNVVDLLLFLVAIVLYVLRFMISEYPFGISNVFLMQFFMSFLRLFIRGSTTLLCEEEDVYKLRKL